MKYNARIVGRVNIPHEKRIMLDHQNIEDADYSNRSFWQFCTVGARLTRCRFNKTQIEHAEFGSGKEMSEFIDCTFDGAMLNMDASGGYSRFVRCSFRDVEINNWFCLAVELVDCVLGGRLSTEIFNGAVPEHQRNVILRKRNEFHGNDFSGMTLIDVAFRTGIDLTKQRLPSGPEYLHIQDAARTLEIARDRLSHWHKGSKEQLAALRFIKSCEEDVRKGQKQLFLRKDDYLPFGREAIDEAFALLRAAQDSNRAS